jgi:hypothetical protein
MATSKREEMFKKIEVYDTNTQPAARALELQIPNGINMV